MPAIYYSKEREKLGRFTKTYIHVQEKIFVRKDSDFHTAEDLKYATFAWVDGYENIQQVKKKFPNIKTIKVANLDEAINAVISKKADALIDSKIIVEHLLKEKKITDLIGIPQDIINTQDLKMLVQKDNHHLYNIINKTLKNISEDELISIKKRWSNQVLFLKKDEKRWLANHKTLKIAVDPHFLPFTGSAHHDGLKHKVDEEYVGMTIELLNKALKNIGIKPQYIETKSWSDSYQSVKSGKADILTTTAYLKSREKFFRYTKATNIAPRVIAINKKTNDIHELSDLKTKKVGLIKDGAIASKVLTTIDLQSIIWYTNIETALNDLNEHKIDAFVDSFYVLAYLTNEHAFSNIELVNKFDTENKLYLAVNKQNISNIGVNVLNKALDSLTKAEKSEIQKRWSSITLKEEVDYTIIFQILGVSFLMILFTLYWLQKVNKAKKIAEESTALAIQATKEADEAKAIIEALHKHTRESIEYASMIQGALIPPKGAMSSYFKDHFVTWTPKDTVGGDIWLFNDLRHKDECLLFVVDCTGHGVPGAFVTMIVKAVEREIVSKIKKLPELDISPAIIMGYFNKTMKKLLRQETKDSVSNAGWDGAIIYYNRKTQILKFAGAETALFYMTNDGEFKTVKGNRYSIGYKKCDMDYQYKETVLEVEEGMKFYCTTDGYLDQNGGEKDFPFGKKRFGNLIKENYKENMTKMQTIFQSEMIKWESAIPNNERNDDMTVIGFEIGKTSV